MLTVRLVVLGAPAVGKTSLIEVLVSHSVQPLCPTSATSHCLPSATGQLYSVTAILNDLICHISLIEVPSADCFRPDSAVIAKLATADACLLLFDLTQPETFHFVKLLRDQLFEGRVSHWTPVFVVGNKADCIPAALNRIHAAASTELGQHHHHHHHHHHHFSHSHHEPAVAFKDLAALVRKQWKWAYAEVSTLHHWHVQSLLQRVLDTVSHSRLHEQPPPHDSTKTTTTQSRPEPTTHRSTPPPNSPSCHIL